MCVYKLLSRVLSWRSKNLVFDFPNEIEEWVLLLLRFAVLLQRRTILDACLHGFGHVALSLPRRRLIFVNQEDSVAPGNAAACNNGVLLVQYHPLISGRSRQLVFLSLTCPVRNEKRKCRKIYTFCRILPLKTNIFNPDAGSVKWSFSFSMTSETWVISANQRKEARKMRERDDAYTHVYTRHSLASITNVCVAKQLTVMSPENGTLSCLPSGPARRTTTSSRQSIG